MARGLRKGPFRPASRGDLGESFFPYSWRVLRCLAHYFTGDFSLSVREQLASHPPFYLPLSPQTLLILGDRFTTVEVLLFHYFTGMGRVFGSAKLLRMKHAKHLVIMSPA